MRGAERGGVRGVAGLAAGHQLEHQQPLLRDRHVEAGGLADDRGLERAARARQLGEDRLGAGAPRLLPLDQRQGRG